MGLFSKNYKRETDESLMQMLGKGDKSAFNELYSRYASALSSYFCRRLKYDKEKGADFMHDLFAKIIERPEMFDPTRTFKTWLYSIANNMCINEYKKMAVRANTQNGLDSSYAVTSHESPISELLHQKNFGSALKEALEEMDDKHSEIFELRFFQELSIKEIAEVMELNEGTVKSRIFYSIKKLALDLQVFDPKYNDEL
jgi:RNA polymerase sigma-70 factor, ECF subfamily